MSYMGPRRLPLNQASEKDRRFFCMCRFSYSPAKSGTLYLTDSNGNRSPANDVLKPSVKSNGIMH
jgi:hypothetical protein